MCTRLIHESHVPAVNFDATLNKDRVCGDRRDVRVRTVWISQQAVQEREHICPIGPRCCCCSQRLFCGSHGDDRPRPARIRKVELFKGGTKLNLGGTRHTRKDAKPQSWAGANQQAIRGHSRLQGASRGRVFVIGGGGVPLLSAVQVSRSAEAHDSWSAVETAIATAGTIGEGFKRSSGFLGSGA